MADLILARFDPEPCDFPKPRVPLLPNRPAISLTNSSKGGLIQRSSFRYFRRGRYALSEAYRLSGVGQEGALLAPAYHCVTMLDPALHLGAEILLYALTADLSPDLTKLEELRASSKHPVKALLATHFFGLAKDFTRLKQWCETHQISLIEDCSHVLFTQDFQATGTGIYGRFVTSSPYKFFACDDGGLLHSLDEAQLKSVQTEAPGLIDELRGIKHSIDKFRSAISVDADIAKPDEQLDMIPVVRASESTNSYSVPSSQFSPIETRKSSLRGSRLIVGISSIEDNVRRRRYHYQQWLDAISCLENCQPLYAELPEHCVPYMFPLRIDTPDPHFYRLKHLGFPIWRWDELAVSNCPVAEDYRFHLLHLPCHQSLTEKQIDWMVNCVQMTLRHHCKE